MGVHFDFNGETFPNGKPRHMGDVHPFWYGGKLYLYYLRTDGSFSSALVTSEDFLTFREEELRTAPPVPTIEQYYVLGVQPYGRRFLSYFGASDDRINGSVSDDLTSWSRIDDRCVPTIHYRTGRDPYLFYDADIGKYRIVYTAYRSNDKTDGLDARLSLQTSVSGDLTDGWVPQERELLRFHNAGFSHREDPECSQLVKIEGRWYLFASIYGRTDHGVGGFSYWMGEEGKPIDAVDWTRAVERHIDGEDLCAAQIFPMDGRYYLLGWIPQNPATDEWGGAVSLLRQVYPLPDGTLGTRLPEFLLKRIRGRELACPGRSAPAGKEFYRQPLGRYPDEILIEATVCQAGHSRWGFLLRGNGEHIVEWGRELTVTTYNGRGRLRARGLWDRDETARIQLVVDRNIAELFVNDNASLAARLLHGESVGNLELSFFSEGEAVLQELRIFRLSEQEKKTV